MRLRFKSILAFIFILFVICAVIGFGYLFYNKIKHDSDIVVDGDLTINYLNGKNFELQNDSEIQFSVTNNSSDTKYFYIQLMDIEAKDVKYELVTGENVIVSNDLKSDIISNQVAINGNETTLYTFKFKTTSMEKYKGEIEIGIKNNDSNTFANVILANNKVGDKALTEFGSNATLDEGLLSMQDDLGLAYYFRGKTINNNVEFAGLNWKIVKINGDGSVKIVLDKILDIVSSYNDEKTDFETSEINEALTKWFDNNLINYNDYIAYYKFCDDAVLESDNTTYNAYSRLITNKIPNLVCLGQPVNAKIGLMTADEIILAGGSKEENKEYYLYNENIKTAYYTMTIADSNESVYYPFIVNTNGALVHDTAGDLLRGVRPTINIIKNARVTGDGTESNPYKIIEN